MSGLERRETFGPDEFHGKLMKDKGIDQASPKMAEYIEMMEAYLLVREKSILEQTNPKEFKLS